MGAEEVAGGLRPALDVVEADAGRATNAVILYVAVARVGLAWRERHAFGGDVAMVYAPHLVGDMVEYDGLLARSKRLLSHVPQVIERLDLSLFLRRG